MPETADIAVQQPATDTTSTALPSSGNEGASPAAQTVPPPQQNDNIRQLREAYEGVKAKYEAYEKLGVAPDELGQHSAVYNRIYRQVADLAREQGYPDDEIKEALAADPIRALDFLREQAQQQQPRDEQGPDLDALIQERLQEALSPIQERENVRATDEANALFERTVHQLAAEQFKKEGIDYASLSEDEKYFITTGVSEVLKYNEQGLRDLKYGGKTAAVQAAFHEFFQLADKYYLARQERGRAKIAPARGANPAVKQEQGKPSLDEMIENPALINAKYK